MEADRRHGGPSTDAAQDLADARLGASWCGAGRRVDVGNVAVIVNDGTIVTPPRVDAPIDLAVPLDLAFSPTGGGFDVAFAPASTDASPGPLPLSDDDTHEVALPFASPSLVTPTRRCSSTPMATSRSEIGDGGDHPARDAARLVSGP